MKVQNIIRVQAVVVGLAATLFVAGAARGQEITNTEWPDRAGATESVQVAAQADQLNATNESSATVATTAGTPTLAQEAASSQAALLGGWSATFLVGSALVVGLYAMSEIKRITRNVDVRSSRANVPVTMS